MTGWSESPATKVGMRANGILIGSREPKPTTDAAM